MNRQDIKFINSIHKRAAKFLYKQKLLKKDDRILIGLSGGKDSLVMLEVLAECKRHLPFSIELIAAHIKADSIGYQIDLDYLDKICNQCQIRMLIREIDIILTRNSKKSPCFVCSWHRRKELFRLSKELKCNKIALGHHMDDALETLFLNMIYHGSVSSLPEKLTMFNQRIELIRPLLHFSRDELSRFALLRGFKSEEKTCKYANESQRTKIKDLLQDISRLNDNSRINLFRAMSNIYNEYLPGKTD